MCSNRHKENRPANYAKKNIHNTPDYNLTARLVPVNSDYADSLTYGGILVIIGVVLSDIKKQRGINMADIPPVVLSAIICDRVLFDAPTKTASIIGIRDKILAKKYPATVPQLYFFSELTNGHGSIKATVRLVDVKKNDAVLAERSSKIKFATVKTIATIVLVFEGLVFPHPGEYRFILNSDGHPLADRAIKCVQMIHVKKSDPDKQQH